MGDDEKGTAVRKVRRWEQRQRDMHKHGVFACRDRVAVMDCCGPELSGQNWR